MSPLQVFTQSIAALRSWWRRLFKFYYHDTEQPSPFLALPTELKLHIIAQLPDASRASLALTCKTLLSLQSSSTPFKAVGLPREEPPNIQSMPMSKPSIYHPTRWEFLSFLERDLKGTWLRCSECLSLHPKHMFAEYERSIAPWLTQYYKAKASEYRSCRHGRRSLCRGRHPAFWPSGIVDLCPCIKLTIGQKLQLEAKLADHVHYQGRSAHSEAESWSHECRHTYGAIDIAVRIRFFLYEGTRPLSYLIPMTIISGRKPKPGSLGVLLEYRHTYPFRPFTYPSEPPFPAPRIEDGSAGMTTFTYRVERCLDDDFWPMQTIFPLARRHKPLKGSPYPRNAI
ncbi:MAG: hypothetical protein Q9202_007575 [Teloschistes flavicans]